MTGNPAHGLLPDPIRNPSFRAKQADALSSLPLPRKVGLRREKSLLDSIGSFADFLLRRLRLNLLLCSAVLVLAIGLNAQAPIAVPIPKEPHHHLVFENSYVRVFRVSVPAHEATLLHQHDVPYLYVALGPADVINAVQGKPEVRLVMADEQVGYSPGHFAHIARNQSDAPFNNVTIELLKPQGEPRNLCAQIFAGAAVGECQETPANNEKGFSAERQLSTAQVVVELVHLSPKAKKNGFSSLWGSLFVVLNESEVQINSEGEPRRTFSGGGVAWLRAGTLHKFSNPSNKASSYLRLIFLEPSA
jgi:hypothetical protein